MLCRTISIQVATIIFTTRLKKELAFLGQSAEDLSNILSSLGQGVKIPVAVAPLVIRGFEVAIRDGLYVALAFAVLSLLFAMALPWPRLKGGITDHRQSDELENNHASIEDSNQ